MNDMVCPYCGAEWKHKDDDLVYAEEEGEYECPACKRIFIMVGELEPVFYEETVEDYYERKIMLAKDHVERYKNKINMYIENGDKKKAGYYKFILDAYRVPHLRKLEEALKRCIEHNKMVCR